MERGEGGAIVNVSSLSSLCALKDHAVYCKLVCIFDELIRYFGQEKSINNFSPTMRPS